jgi:hypothetical protein
MVDAPILVYLKNYIDMLIISINNCLHESWVRFVLWDTISIAMLFSPVPKVDKLY